MTGWGVCRRCRTRIWWGVSPYNADRAFPFDDDEESQSHFETCSATEWVEDLFGERHRVAECKTCGAKVWWQTTPNGKRRPMDVDGGECHFDTCDGERVADRDRVGARPEPEPARAHKYSKRAPGSYAEWLADLELVPMAYVSFTRADVQAAFRRLAMRHHPDMGGDAWDFIRIKWAYDRLKEVVA